MNPIKQLLKFAKLYGVKREKRKIMARNQRYFEDKNKPTAQDERLNYILKDIATWKRPDPCDPQI
jgi:hypothetical protein